MVASLLVAVVVVFVIIVVLAFLLKLALKMTLGIAVAALIIFGGIFLFSGKAGFDSAVSITGATVADVADSGTAQQIAGAVKETAGEVIEAGKEQAKELMNDTQS